MTFSINIGIIFRSSPQRGTQTCKSNGGHPPVICVVSEYGGIFRAGTVESRIRQLVMKLEYVDSLTLAHPFIKGFEQILYCSTDEEVRLVAQGEISDAVLKRKKEEIEGKEGGGVVYSTTFYIGLLIEPKQGKHPLSSLTLQLTSSVAGAVGPRRLDISYPTQEFTKLVRVWEKFDESCMSIVVQHIKRSATRWGRRLCLTDCCCLSL
jgi:poly(A) polymerase